MISEGQSATISFDVTQAATAAALGSGDVEVLGTPKIVALAEEAAVAAIAGSVPDDSTTVGTNVTIDHLLPSQIGATVHASATVTSVDGRRVGFAVQIREGDATVARGTHQRVVVERSRFLPS
ncbi:MAG: thioesterase family protein [Acidimicrobiia bacterium]